MMPPKRQPSTRGSAKKNTAPPESEDAKPVVNPVDGEAELPSTAPESQVEGTPAAVPVAQRAAPSTATPSTRGRKPVSQPRGKRRSQAQLQELQRSEEERRQAEAKARAAEEASRAARANREAQRRSDGPGRTYGRGRGRGGYMGESHATPREYSGPFSAEQANREKRKKSRGTASGGTKVRGGRSEGSEAAVRSTNGGAQGGRQTSSPATTTAEDGSLVKTESATHDESSTAITNGYADVPMEDALSISSDEDSDSDQKGNGTINVEDLDIVDLTTDEPDPFAPVRVHRVAHKERAVGINADGATNLDGAITVDANDVATVSSTGPERTAKTAKGKGKQRATTATKDVEITGRSEDKVLDTFHGTYSDSDSDGKHEKEVLTRIKSDPDAAQASDLRPQEPLFSSSPDAKRKAKEKIKAVDFSSDVRPEDYQTREEIEEWERHQRDLEILRRELSEPATDDLDRRKDKVYLFQLPPVLPDLHPISVKPDPDSAAPTNGEAEPMDVDNPITIPEDTKDPKPALPLPSGHVGKLRVHASGRVTLDWGGTSFCVGMGGEASFLQDVLVLDLPEEKREEGSGSGVGNATSMGQVKGKFVVTPDWEEILR